MYCFYKYLSMNFSQNAFYGFNTPRVGNMVSVSEKIIKEHLLEGEMEAGKEIAVKIDQTLTQDATGTMAYLEFEAMGLPRVKNELAVSYVDHNTLQTDFRNPDDHLYLKSVAEKFGIYYSRPGNGICHQVHLERFSSPGKTLLGSDSHTPTSGGAGMIAIGAGGLDVATAMGGGAFYFNMPEIIGVKLSGKLSPWVSAKDVILEMLRKIGVKGGVGKIYEYFGDGVKKLTVPERATITNMGAELGATTSVFPSDEVTKEFLRLQGREDSWKELKAYGSEDFKEVIDLDLSKVEPMIAKPHSPGNVVPVSEVEGTKVNQVIVGSCTNSSYRDLVTVASILRGKKVHPNVSLAIVPGSKQVYEMIARNGALADLIAAGARILESACGPCIGMGQAPPTGSVTLRTFNRNFEGRCGTKSASAYLCSPEVAAVAALEGEIKDPRKHGEAPDITFPDRFIIDDSMIIPPSESSSVEIVRGPNIKPLPDMNPIENEIKKEVLLKTEDNVTTDHIMPAGAKILPLRSNIPAISEFVFSSVDSDFVKRAKENNGGIIIGGENYGQGSSREHAAIAPVYLGIKAVIVKSFARIHKQNLVNFGILPLEFSNPADYDSISQGDSLELVGVTDALKNGSEITVKNLTKGNEFKIKYDLSKRAVDVLLSGGKINFTKNTA